MVQEGSRGFLGIGGEESVVRVTVVEESADSRVPSDERDDERDDGDGDEAPRRRRRGRRGGRGRRDGRDAPASDERATDDNGDQPRDDDSPGDDSRDDRSGDDRSDEDEPPRRDEFERQQRSGGGGRQRDRGRREGGRGGDGRGRNGRGRGRDSRESRPIEAVSADELILVPGAPPDLPESINPDPEDDVDLFGSALRDLLVHLGLPDTSITARDPETPGDGVGLISQVFDVYGESDEASDELAVLIGRRGETLNSLQYLLNVLSSRQGSAKQVFGVDIEGYRRRREETLVEMAQEIAAEVRATGDVITLEPMPAAERRIIHLALEDEDGVNTESVGRGEDRQVEVLPN